MTSIQEQANWQKYLEYCNQLYEIGYAKGLIRSYDVSHLDKFRKVSFGGVPSSLFFLCLETCQGECYDLAVLMGSALRDSNYQIVEAAIDMLRLNPYYLELYRNADFTEWQNHCFLEETTPDGVVWVYDTSLGLIIEKTLYYLMQKPNVTAVFSKKEIQEYIKTIDIKETDIQRDKDIVSVVLPKIESAVTDEYRYPEALSEEIEWVKMQLKESYSRKRLTNEE